MDNETIDVIVARFRKSLEKRAMSGERIRTIDEIEAAALALRDEAAAAVVEELSSASLKDAEQSGGGKTECRCGRTARYKGLRAHQMVTMAGSVSLRRRYYYCRCCDAGFCPADVCLGIWDGAYTGRVQQEVSRLCTLAPYSVATKILSDLCRVHVSASHAQRMVEEASAYASELLSARLRAAEQADRARMEDWETGAPLKAKNAHDLYIEMDGVQTPLLDGYNEMKVGVCFRTSGKGARGDKSYVSRLGSSQAFAPHLYALAVECGLDTAKRVVVLGDGAHWIWNLADEQFPGAIQVLDLWHVLDRLSGLARKAFGDERAGAVKEWLDQRRDELISGRRLDVKNALTALALSHPDCAEQVEGELGYHKNNETRMDYVRYIKEGISIGSGAAESACKRVVTQRLKGAGMRWAHDGAETMAKLRCLVLSMHWNRVTELWRAKSASRQLALAV